MGYEHCSYYVVILDERNLSLEWYFNPSIQFWRYIGQVYSFYMPAYLPGFPSWCNVV